MRLLISCPNCNTSYKIDEKQLSESDGQARCYQCQQVFNGMLNAQPLPDDDKDSGADDRLNLPDSDELFDQDSESPDSALLGSLSEPDISSLFDDDEHSEIVSGPDDISLSESAILMPEELLDIDTDKLVEIEPLSLGKPSDAKPKNYTTSGTVFWSLGILLLLAVFLLQVGWVYRSQLLANPESRALIEAGCEYITCDLPPRRAPEAFEIVERHVSIHPEVKGILSVNILFANKADFTQQAPGITLSLYDAQQQLISRRSFSYKDYMDHYSRKAPVFEAGQTQKVFLNLEDPGPDVTGFEFNFF